MPELSVLEALAQRMEAIAARAIIVAAGLQADSDEDAWAIARAADSMRTAERGDL